MVHCINVECVEKRSMTVTGFHKIIMHAGKFETSKILSELGLKLVK